MGIFSKPKNKKELALILDLGSSSVGGALVLMVKGKVSQIIFSIRESIEFEKNINFKNFLSSTMKSLNIVAGEISAKGIGVPTNFFCVLSSPWYFSQIRIISLKKNTPFVFTSKLADELIKKENFLFGEEYLKNSDNKNKVRQIELKNIKTVLNGYITNKPLNKKVKEIEMSIFISVSPEDILDNIENIIDRHFHRKKIIFSSFTLASFTIVRNMFISQDNFVLVDICGEITELSLVKNDALSLSVSFPIGHNYFVRSLASVLKCSLNEAKSYISLYKDNHASVAMEKKLKPIIEKLKSDWLAKFQESLVSLSNNVFIPSVIFMTVDEELAEFFAGIIKNEQFNQYSFAQSKFKVIHLGIQMLHNLVEYKKDVKHDPFIAIESVYINRFLI